MDDKRKYNGRFDKGYTYRDENHLWNKDWLIQKYNIEKLTVHQIAELCGKNYRTVCYWMNKHGIVGRVGYDSRKVKEWGKRMG